MEDVDARSTCTLAKAFQEEEEERKKREYAERWHVRCREPAKTSFVCALGVGFFVVMILFFTRAGHLV